MPSEVVTNLLDLSSEKDTEAVVTQPVKNTVLPDKQEQVKQEKVAAPDIIDNSKTELAGETRNVPLEEKCDNLNGSDFIICCSQFLDCFLECWLWLPHLICCDGACLNHSCDCCVGCCESCGDL